MTRKNRNPKKKGMRGNHVQESSRIQITEALERFRVCDDNVYTFGNELSAPERAVVHIICRKMGMTSKSSGTGQQRSVSIYKSKKNHGSTKSLDDVVKVAFSEESKSVLQELFAAYPPGDEDYGLKKRKKKLDKVERKVDDAFSLPSMTKADVARQLEILASKTKGNADFRQVMEDRNKLPIASYREEITSSIDCNQVVLISGETGCGKTTQVPQYILDYLWGKQKVCKIVCTQPRRISASSVSERISYERGEVVGNTVGYKIRFECKGGRNSSIMFCTNGILLRLLVSHGLSGEECGITHIIVDEIHERDRHSDFLLAILRDMLPSHPNLRLVLMSATIDIERFSQYFKSCPVIRVPGFTHPVKAFFLEDVLSIIHSKDNNHLDVLMDSMSVDQESLSEELRISLEEAIDLASSNDDFDPLLELISSEGNQALYNHQHSRTGLTPLMVFAKKGRVAEVCTLLSFGADSKAQTKEGLTAFKLAEKAKMAEVVDALRKHNDGLLYHEELLDRYLATTNPEFIDVSLIEQLIKKICVDSNDNGAILVFLPGWDDINKTRDKLKNSSYFKNHSKFLVHSLHSMVPSAEQRKVFKRPPRGCRKIILSTNIAETAVTIDDVVYVIDSGRMKEKSYDPYNNVSTLHSSWISKASAKQRLGRAGRCQPGICYRLYSRNRAASFRDFQVPEIRRMSVEELCLQVKLFDPNCRIEDFLMKTLDPPVSEAIRNAVSVLEDIGALSSTESLTSLGKKLSCLPVHPVTSKMLFFAILMKCLDPALTLACASDYKDPFTLPFLSTDRKKLMAAKTELADLYGGYSDQLAVISAFECWKNARDRNMEDRFCANYFVSSSTMRMIEKMRNQLLRELTQSLLLPENIASLNANSRDLGILRAVIVAGLYPMMGRIHPKSGKNLYVETVSGSKARLHCHSLNAELLFKETKAGALVVFDEINRGDGGMFIRSSTVLGPLPLLLLCTEIAVVGDSDGASCDGSDDDDGGGGKMILSSPENVVRAVVDRWLFFALTALESAQIYCLRERLNNAILFKVTFPNKELPAALEYSVMACARVLSFDGLSSSLVVEAKESRKLRRCPSGVLFDWIWDFDRRGAFNRRR